MNTKFNDKNFLIRLGVLTLSVILVFIFSSFSQRIDLKTAETLSSISFEHEADTNIVLIKITASDIEKLGNWPLKRSYYALLINSLANYNPKAIGLEIYLSGNTTFQSTYDDLMREEISKSGNVILGSLIAGLNSNDDGFSADSIMYPKLKNKFPEIKTGHLNYFEQGGLYIPSQVINGDKIEKCFSLALVDNNKTINNNFVKINLANSWSNYKSISLLDFFTQHESQEKTLSFLKNKYIIIGVTDPSIAKSVYSNIDEYLPGLGFHAIALDNFINDTYWKETFYLPSIIIFIVMLIAILLFSRKKHILRFYLISFFLVTIFGYLFTNMFYWNIAYSAFIIPIFLLLLTEVYMFINHSQA